MLKISFNFDEASQTVSNVKVEHTSKTNNTSKMRGVISLSSPTEDLSNVPDVEVLENKLQLSKNALYKLEAKSDDRISIQYVNEGIGKACPVIGKAEMFTDRLDGNRLTQKSTVSFRGEKRNTLIEFGTRFNLQEYKDGIWKLVPIDSTTETDDLSEETNDLEVLNNSEIDNEIQEITSSMVDDDLPF